MALKPDGPTSVIEEFSMEQKTIPVPHAILTSKYDRKLEIHGWTVSTSKRPISNAKEIDAASDELTIPLPEMIFGNNSVRVCHSESGINISWDTLHALDAVDKSGTDLRVAYSDNWNKTRDLHSEDIKQVMRPYDWTYTTDYRGTTSSTWIETEETLPLELLKRQDPIIFYDEVILYESELDDNGASVLTVRVRVMPERLLILARFFMRLDDVVFRVRDTRLYVEFATKKVLREYLVRQDTYNNVKSKIRKYEEEQTGELLNDPNWVSQKCPIIDGKMEVLHSGGTAADLTP